MTFSGLRVGGVYVYVTRGFNTYLMIVKELDRHNGHILATRSTLDGTEVCTRWYREGTVCGWRTRSTTVNRLLANTPGLTAVLLLQSQTSRPA